MVLSGQAASAWLMVIGALGLLGAGLFSPRVEHPVRGKLISARLISGERAMAPLSIGILATGGPGVPIGLLLVILGPALLGLHSLTQSALRLWRTRSPWLLSAVGRHIGTGRVADIHLSRGLRCTATQQKFRDMQIAIGRNHSFG